jgi:hypothetical protein
MKKKKSKEDYAFLSECTITTFTRDGGRNGVAEQQREKKKLHSRNGGEAKRPRASSNSSSTRDDNDGVFDTFLHISEQVAVVAIVSAVFVLVHARAVRAEEVLVWSVLSAIVGMFCTRVDEEDGKKTKSKDRRITLITAFRRRVRLGLSVAFAVAISSPLFLTMTASVSDDTAVAVSGILAFVHLATHDYRAESTSLGNALEGVSLVSAIFSSSLMASRLETVLDAFACALLAVGAFTMSMPLRRQLRRRAKSASSFATAFLAHGIASWMLKMINRNLMIAYGITIGLFLTFTPLSFAFARRTLKMKIEGPWAEAQPELDLMRSSVRRAGVPIFRHILANAPSRGKGDR